MTKFYTCLISLFLSGIWWSLTSSWSCEHFGNYTLGSIDSWKSSKASNFAVLCFASIFCSISCTWSDTCSGKLLKGESLIVFLFHCKCIIYNKVTYLCPFSLLFKVCGEARPERLVLCEAQRRVEMGLVSGEISHPAALSLDTLSCGLQALVSIGAIHRLKR